LASTTIGVVAVDCLQIFEFAGQFFSPFCRKENNLMKRSRKSLSRLALATTVLLLVLLASSLVLAQGGSGGLTANPSGLSIDGEALETAKPGQNAFTTQEAIDPSTFREVSVIITLDESVSADAVAAEVDGTVVNRYDKVFNGASLILAGDDVATLAELDGVTGVYLDQLMQLDTEVSPQFIGAPTTWNALGGQGSAGEGVVVGILDSGIWPEHPSMSDPDPLGKPYAAPPTTPASCAFGSASPGDVSFTCNNKLIGAYQFLATYKAVQGGLLATEFNSARDDGGHGTHTATTTAGNRGVAASIFGVPFGTVSGVAPRAHVIAYRVCANAGCYSSDSVAAVNQAIIDGVDVINFSISGGNNPYSDAVELAFASAYENGVFVATSAGNSGPTPETVAHRSPWVTTVAASTSNRHFLTTLALQGDNGDTLSLTGATVTDGITSALPVVFPPAGQELCNAAFNPAPGTYTGKIVACRRGDNARIDKSYRVSLGGGAGMILYNPAVQGLNTDNHYVATVHIDQPDSTTFLNFMSSHTGVTATFDKGTATAVLGDMMASFSSRGGPLQPLGISKPDITAPGVQILAGQTPMPATAVGGPSGELFQAIQGTSMSSPHIAGSAALIKDLRPDWTPGQIKSALMTTAVTNVVKEDGVTPTNAFDDGSGRVDLTRAGWAELTFDETIDNYMDHATDLWVTNYPSLYVPHLSGSLTVQRTVHNELNKKATWTLKVTSDPGLTVTVPKKLSVPANGYATFDINVSAPNVPLGEVRFATLTLKRGSQTLTFPITIVRGEEGVTIDKECADDTIGLHEETPCSITIANYTFEDAEFLVTDFLPKDTKLANNYPLVGATAIPGKKNAFQASGTLPGAQPPDISIAPGSAPSSYLPLSIFSGSLLLTMSDEAFVNVNVPTFNYGGTSYNRIGVSANGYLVVGGGTTADSTYVNQVLPNANRPNNVLAPFWTDLNPGGAGNVNGAVRVNVLSDGIDQWIVVDWNNVRNYSSAGQRHDMNIWIGLNTDPNPGEDISFVYGTNAAGGDGGFGTVGAENLFGNRGDNYYVDGTGTLPVTGTQLVVTTTPPSAGGTYTIDFGIHGRRKASWTNCASLTTNLFSGTAIDCFSGETTH